MVPKKIEYIEKIPYLDSGKIDEKKINILMNDY